MQEEDEANPDVLSIFKMFANGTIAREHIF
jgi:hypothetical protein